MSSGLMQPLIVVAAWVLGLIVIYEWGTRPKSSLLRLDGGRLRADGGISALVLLYTGVAGLLLGLLRHQGPGPLLYGLCVGVVASQAVVRGIARKRRTAATQAVSGPAYPAGGRARTVLLLGVLYVSFWIGTIGVCLWLRYALHEPAWVVATAGGVTVVAVTAYAGIRWASWKRRHPG